VGGASLKAHEFATMIEVVAEVYGGSPTEEGTAG
jgi:hypothetical protein